MEIDSSGRDSLAVKTAGEQSDNVKLAEDVY